MKKTSIRQKNYRLRNKLKEDIAATLRIAKKFPSGPDRKALLEIANELTQELLTLELNKRSKP